MMKQFWCCLKCGRCGVVEYDQKDVAQFEDFLFNLHAKVRDAHRAASTYDYGTGETYCREDARIPSPRFTDEVIRD